MVGTELKYLGRQETHYRPSSDATELCFRFKSDVLWYGILDIKNITNKTLQDVLLEEHNYEEHDYGGVLQLHVKQR